MFTGYHVSREFLERCVVGQMTPFFSATAHQFLQSENSVPILELKNPM